jgi:hypothetical protein
MAAETSKTRRMSTMLLLLDQQTKAGLTADVKLRENFRSSFNQI